MYKARRVWAGTGVSPSSSAMTVSTGRLCSTCLRPHADLVLGVLLCFFTGDQPQPGCVLHVPETLQQGNANTPLICLTNGKQNSQKFHSRWYFEVGHLQ